MSKIFQYPTTPILYHAEPHDFTGDYMLGLRTAETTQRFVYGTRHITWDGRVFKYSNSTDTVIPYHGATSSDDNALTYTALPSGANKGERYVVVTLGSRTEDDLAGGYIIVYHSTIDNSTQYGIVGNEATSGTTTKIYIDGALPYTTTASFAAGVFENLYRALNQGTDSQAAIVGVPCINTTTGYKLWIQTWGPCVISAGNATVGSPGSLERTVYWAENGTLKEEDADYIDSEAQHAGYLLPQGATVEGPFIMMMCST